MLRKRSFRTALTRSSKAKQILGLVIACFWASSFTATAQQPPSIFGASQLPVEPVVQALPPEGSPILLKQVELRFPTQGNVGGVDYDTYLYYMEIKDYISLPSQGKWVPYSEATEQIVLDDHERLWNTGFLSDLWIEVIDDPYSNGVPAKRIIFNLEERERVKIVSYEGSDELKVEDINLNLEEQGISMRLDSFIDPGTIRRVKSLLSNMFAAKGYPFAEIDHAIETVAGGPKLVSLKFSMSEGSKVQVHAINFFGNSDMTDKVLKKKMKKVKERYWLSWMTGRGTYKPEEYEEDAEAIEAYYRDEGYIEAQVGQPIIDYLDESEDGKTRGMTLRIPIDEGERYRIGELTFSGNELLLEEGLRDIFDNINSGDFYSEGDVRKGFDDARELYGSLGYYEMTLAPDLSPRTDDQIVYVDELDELAAANEPAVDSSPVSGSGDGNTEAHAANIDGNSDEREIAEIRPARIDGAPVVDVTIRVQEGEQFFVNRIEFTGNSTTHDEVIRRELQIVENAVFNTEALKYSVRRLNQLGFFEPLDDAAVNVEKNEEVENEVNVTIALSEANLNQLTFGAGVSQFDGFFGQISFSTSNFLGRGETLAANLMSGSRSRNHSISFTRPFNFGRPLSISSQVYSRRMEWIGSFTEETTGASVTAGFPLSYFTRFYLGYSLDQSQVSDINPFMGTNPELLAFNPFLSDALLLGSGGLRTISKVIPQIRYDTVDHPIFPTTGTTLAARVELAGAGGNTRFIKPTIESTWWTPHLSNTIFGVHAQMSYIMAGNPDSIPVFERLWLGGEYSVRGFDIRRIGPTMADVNPDMVNPYSYQGRMVLGGNKSLLVNVEYQFLLGGPIRLISFYDAGQVQNFGSQFIMNDFKTSTGIELRIFMPMLNVPFRLIYYYNPQLDGVFNDRLYEQERHGFRFSMGSTF